MSSVHIGVTVAGGETILDAGDDNVSVEGDTLVFEDTPEYTEYDYIQSSGDDAWFTINTIFSGSAKVELEFLNDVSWSWAYPIHCSESFVFQTEDTSLSVYGLRYKTDGSTYNFNLDASIIPQKIRANATGTLVNMLTGNTLASRSAVTDSSQIYIDKQGRIKIMSLKVYNSSGELIIDAVPAKLNATQEIGLYNKISNLLIGHSGTGTYSPGMFS